MKTPVLGAVLGAFAGFTTVLLLHIFVISNAFVRAVLFPGNIFIRFATHEGVSNFGLMIFDSLAYFSNLLLYAAIGFAVGKLFETRRPANSASEETSHD